MLKKTLTFPSKGSKQPPQWTGLCKELYDSHEFNDPYLIFNHLIYSSLVSVFVNKSLLSGSARLDAPLFVTWYQCIVTVLACYIIRQLARYFPDKVSFPELELDEKILKQVKLTITRDKLFSARDARLET